MHTSTSTISAPPSVDKQVDQAALYGIMVCLWCSGFTTQTPTTLNLTYIIQTLTITLKVFFKSCMYCSRLLIQALSVSKNGLIFYIVTY